MVEAAATATDGQASASPPPQSSSTTVGGGLRNMVQSTSPTANQAGVAPSLDYARLQAQQHAASSPQAPQQANTLNRSRAVHWSDGGFAHCYPSGPGGMYSMKSDTNEYPCENRDFGTISSIHREEVSVTVTGSGSDGDSMVDYPSVTVTGPGSESDNDEDVIYSSDTVTGPEQSAKPSFHDERFSDSETSTGILDSDYSDPVLDASPVCRVRCGCVRG